MKNETENTFDSQQHDFDHKRRMFEMPSNAALTNYRGSRCPLQISRILPEKKHKWTKICEILHNLLKFM